MAGALTAAIAAAFSGGAAAATDPYFEYTTLLLPGSGTNGAQNNTFLDGSTNNFTITRNGNTTQGTFSPFSQTGWGNYFDGSSYLSISTASSTLDFGTGDFTIEMWVNPLAQTTSFPTIISCASAWSAGAFYIRYHNTGAPNKFGIYWNGVGDPFVVSSSTYQENTWHHVAVTRSGSTVTLWVNGTSAGTGTSSASLNLALGSGVWVGNNASASCNYKGYISNIRVVKGVAVYTGAFTPPTSPLAATQSAGTNISAITGTQTSLLTCQSNRFIDNSSNNFTITRNGDTRVVAFSPFNPSASWSAATYGGSGYFDGSGDGLTYTTPSTVVREWWVNDFTVEAWVYPTSLTGWSYVSSINLPTLIGNASTSANVNYWSFGPINTGAVSLVYFNGGSVVVSSTETVKINQWNHIAFTKTSSGVSIFVNGIGTTATAVSGTPQSQNSVPLSIGLINATSINGYASNVRIVNGTAVYSGTTYTVPTAPLTAITNTSLLLNFTNAGIYDATSKNDLETVGDAQISNAITPKWGSTSIKFDGTGDSLTNNNASNSLISLGTGDFTIECWTYFTSLANKGVFQISTTAGGLQASQTNTLAVNYDSGGAGWGFYAKNTSITGAGTNPLNNWVHIALVRSGTTTTLYVNGTNTISTTSDTTNYTGTYLCVGGYYSTSYLFIGYIQDFRITKGYARYTTNFTPPTAAFPTL